MGAAAAAVAAAALALGRSHAAPVAAPPFNSTWLRSYPAKVNLTTVANSSAGITALRWDEPEHFSAIFSYLPKPALLSKDGDKVNISMRWRSSGQNLCPASCVPSPTTLRLSQPLSSTDETLAPSCYAGHDYCQATSCQKAKCASKSVNCLAGTGDFRIALLDTSHSSEQVKADDWCAAGVGYKDMTKCVEASPFDKMRGYDFRIFPHLTPGMLKTLD